MACVYYVFLFDMQIHREQTNSGYLNTQTSNDNGKKRHQTSCGAAKTKTKRSSVSISSCCCLRSPATSFIPKQKRSRSCIYISENQKKNNLHHHHHPKTTISFGNHTRSCHLKRSKVPKTFRQNRQTRSWDLWDLRILGMVRQNLFGMI